MSDSQVPQGEQSDVIDEGQIHPPLEDLSKGPVFYANTSLLTVTGEDAILTFIQRGIEGQRRPVGVATIYTTLPHLKRLTAILENSIKNHEKTFGEIVIDAEESAQRKQAEQSDGTNDTK